MTYVFVCFSKYDTPPGVMIIVPTPHRDWMTVGSKYRSINGWD